MDDAALARRFSLIEQQLRAVSEELGIPCPPFGSDGSAPAGETPEASASASGSALPAEVVELAQAGRSTEAISRLRHLTGASLLEARRAVDAL